MNESDLPINEAMNYDLEATHEEGRSSGENGINNDVEMGIGICSISTDRALHRKAMEWQWKKKYEIKVNKKSKNEVQQMNDALSKEGFDYGVIEVYSPKRVTGIEDLMGLILEVALHLTKITWTQCLGISVNQKRGPEQRT